MPSRTILERLDAGDVLLMDGGTGTEAARRGADLFNGYQGPLTEDEIEGVEAQHDTHDAYLRETDPAEMRRVHEQNLRLLGPWSAPLNLSAPDLLQTIHEDYLRAGADILISNNFFTSASKLERIGAGDDWQRYAIAGAEIAIAARDRVNPEAYVAAGIAPPADGDLYKEFSEQSRVLADAGVDFMLPEYLGAIDECVTAVRACADAGLPVILAVRHVREQGTMQYLESFADLIAALDGMPFDGILVMCANPANVSPSLRNLRDVYDGPIGAYPHNPRQATNAQEEVEQLQTYAKDWLAIGAQIIGGCCGTTPEHIAGLAPIVKGQAQPA